MDQLFLFTVEDILLQSLAVTELNLDSWIEPASRYEQPYDSAFQQVTSIYMQGNGLKLEEITKRVFSIDIFRV